MPCNQKQCECWQCLQKCNSTTCATDCQCGDSMISPPSCMTCLEKNNLTKCGCKPPRPPTISLLHILLIAGGVVVVVGVTIGLIVYFNTKKKSKK
jgi:hypothetical protein